MNFYSCIIGSELLNGRRADAHFSFVNTELLKRGWEQKASFIIKDDPKFIADIFRLIAKDEQSVMFCFGGIGSTPDDYTREVAAEVFSNGKIVQHQGAAKLIIERFGDSAYPNRIQMAYLPEHCELLSNPINQIPGFFLQDRFFFVPGFPQMAHPMVTEALNRFYPKGKEKFSHTFTAMCSEEALIFAMQQLPASVEFSSLPIMDGSTRAVELYVASLNREEAYDWYLFLRNAATQKGFETKEGGYF